ncbi:hypothetical protein [Gallaecimonas sp. GXIMD4217]|uniref:DUF7507 domain-containing protein n=1 Tax=Gallaecimonas sp. GXIMD4217 TaxID=3131927 RepID=UPI00311AFD3A
MTSFFLGALFGTTLVVMLTVMAVHTGMTDEFELGPTSDGAQNANIVNDVGGAPPDWAEIFDANGNFNDSFGGVGTFLMDDLSAKGAVDDTTFATSNKNNDLISTWRWDTGNNPPKDDISNVYFYGKFIDGDLILYAGLERLAPNGDSHVDFEFNQDGIALDKATPCGDDLSAGADDDPPCEFVGEKAVNDLLLVMDFERGGSLGFVEIRRWDGSEYVLVEELQGEGCDMTDTACAFNNATTIDTGPWDSYDRHGAVVTELEQNAFTEIGVNVTELLGVTPCFSTVQAKTRSSQSFNSELKDFAQGGFDLCSIEVVKDGEELAKIGDEVTYDFMITNTGEITLFLESIIDDKLGNITSDAPGSCDPLAPGGSCSFSVAHTIPEGASDPYDNIVTATYDNAAALDGTDVTDSDDHSLNLFQPAIAVDKTGDDLSKVGDEVDYSITLSNNSSADTPDLHCVATDSLLGVVFDDVLPLGDTVLTPSRTVQAGDPDPLVNTVDLSCSPAGFPNVLDASDSHSTDLFQPSIALDKTGDTLSKVGDSVDYVITLDNTSSSDTPDLECTISDTLLGVSESVTLASGAQHVINASRVVQAGDPDPLLNTAEASCSPIGFANVLTDSDGHSVQLFQASITLDKTGDTLSKVGDSVDYVITLDNTSSADTPDLECTITDTLLGVSQSATLASGAQHVINASRVVLAGDPDPVVNTAEVSCSPIGFANVLTDSDGHSVNLFQPSITVDKSNDCDPITGVFIGQNITYSYLITNTSSADTPALNVLSIIDSDDFSGLPWPGLGDLTGVEASCASLASGASCSFNVVQSTSGLAQGSYGNKVVATYQVDGWPNQAMAMDNDTCPVFPPNPARLVVEKVLENAEGLTFFYDSSNIVDVPGLAWDETLTPVLPVAGQNAASPFAMPTEAFATTVELTVDVPDVTQTVEVKVAELMPTDAAFVDLQCAAATGQSLTGQSIDLDLREATLTMASDDFAFCRFVNAKLEFCPGTLDENGNFISNFGRPKELEIRYDGDPASNGPQLGSGDVTIDPDPPAYVPEEVYIEVYDNRGNKEQLLLTTGTLMVGDTFTYTGADGSKVPPTSLFRIYDAETGELIQTVEFHTSCSQPLDVGDSYGLLTVAGGELGDPK